MKKYNVRIDDEENVVELEPLGENTYQVSFKGISYQTRITEIDERHDQPAAVAIQTRPLPVKATAPKAVSTAATTAGSSVVNAPLAGTILSLNVTPGVKVQKGTLLCVLEAMKMETDIKATGEGVIEEVRVKAGDTVQPGDILFVLG